MRFCPQKNSAIEFKIFLLFDFSPIRSFQIDATIWRWRGTRRSRGGTKKRGRCEFYFSQIFVSFFLLHSFFCLIFSSFTDFCVIFPQIHPIHVRRQHGVGLTQLDRSILHVRLVVQTISVVLVDKLGDTLNLLEYIHMDTLLVSEILLHITDAATFAQALKFLHKHCF